MKKLTLLISLLILTCNLWSTDFYTVESINQGELLTLVISPAEDSVQFTFHLENSSGVEIFNIKGFNYYFFEEKESIILGLVGIPSNLPPGKYKIKARGRGILQNYFFERPLEVLDREFPNMVIVANPVMDSIANGEITPERREQSQRLWDSYTVFNNFMIHHEGTFKLPVNGRHSSPFGFERVTKYPSGSSSVSVHNGEDLAIEEGTDVASSGKGLVLLAENRIVTGNTVVIEHLPGVVSIYYHMKSISVTRGDMVKEGDIIGQVGTTGFSTGPHLHWEMRAGTIPVDPMLYIDTPLIDKSLIMNMITGTNNKKGG